MEREVQPETFIELSIQSHLAGLSLSNTVSVLELLGLERVKSTVDSWADKPDRQPDGGRSPSRVAVDESVIRLKNEQYRLYAAVNPDTNGLLHTNLRPTRTEMLPMCSSRNCVRDTTSTTRVPSKRFNPTEKRLQASLSRLSLRIPRKSKAVKRISRMRGT